MKKPKSSVPALTLIGAGAGSGKTHRLTAVVTAAVDPGSTDCVQLEGLVAVTYTRKGAAELSARIRRTFVENGAYDRAQQLPLAYIGTVHAVCLRLVKEFAIDAGLSPEVDVLPGSEARLLREVLDTGLTLELRTRLQALADRLEVRWDQVRRRTDWLTPVQDIMTSARSNRIRPDALPRMADRSAGRLLELLGPPEPDGDALDRDLLGALQAAEKALGQIDDGTKVTQAAREQIRDALAKARGDRLQWSDWVRLQKVKPGASAIATVAPLNALASRVNGHPRLHAELRDFILAIYEAARRGLDAYDDWKKRSRVVDFVDMIDRALSLTDHPDVRAEMLERLELLVVDEFQDTSPVQLALYMKLHEITARSTWVGDRKQCIFEYAGADPTLMEAVTEWARTSGGTIDRLPSNRRSRPELVHAFSRLFTAAFGRHGYSEEEVHMEAQRTTPPELATRPPFGVWSLDTKNIEQDMEALAEGVRRLLDEPSETPVVDRVTKAVRALEPGDVAVLLATNAETETLARALAFHGVRSAIARAGLLSTPEGTLVTAALSYLLDRRDSLSLAQIDALTGFAGRSGEAWLDGLIEAEVARRQAIDRGEESPSVEPSAHAKRLDALREDLDALAPSELLDRVLGALNIAVLCARWPDPEQRLTNIDALRALAREYEEWCTRQREAATLAGLLRYVTQSAEKVLVRDEEIASDNQHVMAGRHTVTIATYHKAKGLEWPVVVLGSLNRGARRDAFEVSPESEGASFDAKDPLGGRWIRYWPWPYGGQQKTAFGETVAASPEGVAVALREERERVRLLYVGFTRARDHLILAARIGKQGPKAEWLDELCDDQGEPLLELRAPAGPTEAGRVGIRSGDGSIEYRAARHWSLSGPANVGRRSGTDLHRWFAPPEAPASERPPYRIAPSRAATEWPDLAPLKTGGAESTGSRLPLGNARGVDWDVVGSTLHAFLAADVPELDSAHRLEVARRLLAASSLLAVLEPKALLQSGDSLRRWVDSRWPGALWRREISIDALVPTAGDARRVSGTIDLLLETANGVVVIDHKSYPGAMNTWREKAATFAPQLAAYSEALTLAGNTVIERWVSFAVAGGAVRIG